jgi:hypothetical protein
MPTNEKNFWEVFLFIDWYRINFRDVLLEGSEDNVVMGRWLTRPTDYSDPSQKINRRFKRQDKNSQNKDSHLKMAAESTRETVHLRQCNFSNMNQPSSRAILKTSVFQKKILLRDVSVLYAAVCSLPPSCYFIDISLIILCNEKLLSCCYMLEA